MFGQNELILNHLTAGERFPPFNKTFEADFKQIALRFLERKGKYLFADDIIKMYGENAKLDNILEQNKDQYFPGMSMDKDGVRQKTWLDIYSAEEITRTDLFFDYFFTIKLRHMSLLEIDGFLDFHLDYSFQNNSKEYSRFLQLTLREYGEKYLNAHIIETAHEWIKANEATENTESPEIKNESIKGRRQRHPGDEQTCLSLKQTALLIGYMKNMGIILDDGLKDTHAGKAFSILTGYSAHSLRMQLGTQGIIDGAKHEDYKELLAKIRKLAALIEADTRNK